MSNETYNSYLDAEGLALVLSGIRDKINAAAEGITNTKGKANGIASLDAGGNVPLSQLGNLDTTFFEVVTELPTDIRNIKKHIYILKGNKDGENNKYAEYIYTGDLTDAGDLAGDVDVTKWEKLGDFVPTFDLQEYVKKAGAVAKLEFYDPVFDNAWNGYNDQPSETAIRIEFADGSHQYLVVPEATAPINTSRSNSEFSDSEKSKPFISPGSAGFMSPSDKGKLDKIDLNALTASINAANTAADNTNKAIKAAETATAGAEKVNATLTEGNVFEVTDRTGAKKTLDLNITAEGSVDNVVGTPSVEITQSVENNKQKLSFNFKNIKGEKGDIGNKGDAFTYDDFTPEQLKTLQDKVVESSKEVAMVEVNKYTDLVKLPNIEVSVSGDTVTLEPNKVYNIAIGESLTLALTPPTDTTITNEYQGSFDTGSTAPTVTFPSNVIWAEIPTINENTHYEFSIRYVSGKYYGLIYGWSK